MPACRADQTDKEGEEDEVLLASNVDVDGGKRGSLELEMGMVSVYGYK